MDTILSHFVKAHPQDVASVLEACSIEELTSFASEIDQDLCAFLPYLSSEKVIMLLDHVSPEKRQALINTLPDMQLATIIKHLSVEKKTSFLQLISAERSARISRLLDFNESQVGYYSRKPRLTLFEHSTVSQALNELSSLNENDLPIYLVNDMHQYIGTVDMVKLIQARNQNDLTLKNLLGKKLKVISAASPLESLLEKKVWGQYQKLVVTGKQGLFLGVISIDVLKQRANRPIQEVKKSTVEEYFYFSEMLWTGMSKLWGTLK